jgi:hypothetical protein
LKSILASPCVPAVALSVAESSGRTRREHGVQLAMIHWINEEKLLKLKRIIEKKNKTRR